MKGILFKPDMIKAIVEGRKTVTRRLGDKPRYKVGEIVYIKEVWRIINAFASSPSDFGIEYLTVTHEVRWWRDNGNIMSYPIDEKLRSPLFMPSIYARYFIQVIDARQENLQDITEPDVDAEGLTFERVMGTWKYNGHYYDLKELAYAELWDSINKKFPYASTPGVWRYEIAQITI